MNVLVTGGAGYIGSICCEVLLLRGFRVIVLDDLREGHRAAVPPEAVFCDVDLADRVQVDEVFDQHRVDAVMHFAGEALVGKSMYEPSRFYVSNVAYGTALLDTMIRHDVKRFIFSSTCAVYGEPEIVPISEECHKAPINPYGKSKLIFEQILEDYHKHAGLDFMCLRYFNAAGASVERGEAHREETHLIPKVLDAALGRTPHVDVLGSDYPTHDGTCIRDYVHVLDIADAHVLALDAINDIPGRAFNIGTGSG